MPSNNNIYKMSNAGGFKSLTRYYDMLAGNTTWSPWEPAGAYEPIAVATVGATSVTSISFGSIPQNYAHLQIRCLTRSTEAATDDNIYMQLNGSSASSYAWHRLLGNGASASAGANSAVSLGLISLTTGSTAGASMFGAAIIDIIDYTNTNKNRTVRGIGGSDQNGGGYVAYQSFGYFNTTTVSSILLGTSLGFAQHSTFALYGIKG